MSRNAGHSKFMGVVDEGGGKCKKGTSLVGDSNANGTHIQTVRDGSTYCL